MIQNSDTQSELSLSALQSGERSEFAKLVEIYSAKIYRLALRMVNDPHDAEDVLQETFIKAFRALPQFEGRSSLSTWLYRIAVNEALMLLRKRKPEAGIEDEANGSDEETGGMLLVDWCCLPEHELLNQETRIFLDKAIESLPASLRVVFQLRDVEGLSVRETAETMGISEMNVKTRLLRARLKLRELISKYFVERSKEGSADGK